MNKVIVLTMSLLLHLFSHSREADANPNSFHSFPTPQPGCNSHHSLIYSGFQSGKTSGI